MILLYISVHFIKLNPDATLPTILLILLVSILDNESIQLLSKSIHIIVFSYHGILELSSTLTTPNSSNPYICLITYIKNTINDAHRHPTLTADQVM
jgi:hypothetical protein